MTNILKDMLKAVPRSFKFIRDSLDSAESQNAGLISILKDHHGFIRQSLEVLLDEEATDSDKQQNLFRLLRLLEMHARAEQETLYFQLKQNAEREVRIAGLASQDEHNIAFRTEYELNQMSYQTDWTEAVDAKAKVLAQLVKSHLKEEEHVLFPLAQKHIGESIIESLRKDYIDKCKSYLDEGENFSRLGREAKVSPENRNLHH